MQTRSGHTVRPIVRSHHERLDGTGYPDGLRGDAVPLLAHIMGIVDVYDAMTTARPYRQPTSPAVACDELLREASNGRHGRELVKAFVSIVSTGALPVIAGEPQA